MYCKALPTHKSLGIESLSGEAVPEEISRERKSSDKQKFIYAGADTQKEKVALRHGTEVADAPLLLGRLLGAQNIDVHSFSSAEKLLEEIRTTAYDVMVLSPTLKGYELPVLIGELRRAAGRRDLPVVVIASSFSDEFRRELIALGRVFPLNVPVNYALLGRLIRESAAGKDV